MSDSYKQILDEEKKEHKDCCGGAHAHMHEHMQMMRKNLMGAVDKSKEKYKSMDENQKRKMFTVIAGAIALLIGIFAINKAKNGKKEE